MPLSVDIRYLFMLSTLTVQPHTNTLFFSFYFLLFSGICFYTEKLTKLLPTYIYHCFFEVTESSQLLLSACLSCDGCVSEDENIKISQQSLEEVKRVLALNKVHTSLHK